MKRLLSAVCIVCLCSPAFATNKPQPVPEWAVNNSAKAESQSHSSATGVGVGIAKGGNASAIAKGGKGGTAIATGGRGGKGGEGGRGGSASSNQNQVQQQSQGQYQDASSRNNVNVDASSDYEAAAASAYVPDIIPTAPCIKGGAVGIQVPGAGASIAIPNSDMWCRAVEECKLVFSMIGYKPGLACIASVSPRIHQALVATGYIRAK